MSGPNMRRSAAAVALLMATLVTAEASSQSRPTQLPPAMRTLGAADPPYGFVQLCQRLAELCRASSTDNRRVASTRQNLAELDLVNRTVNRAITPVSDKDQFGIEEFWTLPISGKGDCEEYVLEKRRLLMDRRWPSGALLITVVLDENRQGHAVLTARMENGDLILDNKHDEIRFWHATPYIYIMRQSFVSPTSWVSLAPTEGNAPAVAAGGSSQ